LNPVAVRIEARGTHRLIPSRFPPVGVFDDVASPEDLLTILELEGWTNDRISGELGILHRIPQTEWVVGTPGATVVMAAFSHPRPGGGRFNDSSRGAWYAAFELKTAITETVFHRTKELDEIGVYDTYMQMRDYLADFDCDLHDVRPSPDFDACHDPDSYVASQALARKLLTAGSNGVVYRSVRDPGHECLACFRPRLVANVRQGAHFEYRWNGTRTPAVTTLATAS
jgi:RES domain-containing protein